MLLRRPLIVTILVLTTGLGISCTSPSASEDASIDEGILLLDTLTTYMTGSFSSALQAAADSDYFDISLHMYPIWQNRTDARWLYVEQALSSRQDAPYRQRVYKVEMLPEGRFASHVYTLANPDQYIGAWKDSNKFETLQPDSLVERTGCTVFLARDGKAFSGATHEADCSSELRGASYATSKVSVFADRIESWDQGFDSAGTQVWGAEKGGYRFDRIR